MALEIERKFFIKDTEILKSAKTVVDIAQSYISETEKQATRVRISKDNFGKERAFLTIKNEISCVGNVIKKEFEYEIPMGDAKELFELGSSFILKDRHILPYENDGDLKWEIDVFKDANKGLVVAEIELPYEDYPLELPSWIDQEVTDNLLYNSNKKLSKNNN